VLTPRLLTALLKFRSDRDWEQFHTPRNIASALSVEAAELLEHFVWSRENQTAQIVEEHRAAITSEMADIAILLTYLAHDLTVDLEAAIRKKLAENEDKYPIERSRGSNKKYPYI
jgi:dCTP diphosphatase